MTDEAQDEQNKYVEAFEARLLERARAFLGCDERLNRPPEDAQAIQSHDEGLRVQTCEIVDGVLRVVASRPIESLVIEGEAVAGVCPAREHFWLVHHQGDPGCSPAHPCDMHKHVVTAAATLTPPCDPSNPCGCHGCVTCNGAQAPSYGLFGGAPVGSTPAYGSPAVACTCGSATCNKCRAQRGMGPAGVTPARGSAKPGGGGSPKTRAASAERGYRVLSYSAWLNREDGSREGDSFSTPDLATQRARRDAKAGKETFIVLRDGARWKLLKQDGDEVVVG